MLPYLTNDLELLSADSFLSLQMLTEPENPWPVFNLFLFPTMAQSPQCSAPGPASRQPPGRLELILWSLPRTDPKGHVGRDGRWLLLSPVFLVIDSDVIQFTVEHVFSGSHQASFDSPSVHGNIVPGQLVGAGGLLLKHIPVPNGCGQGGCQWTEGT